MATSGSSSAIFAHSSVYAGSSTSTRSYFALAHCGVHQYIRIGSWFSNALSRAASEAASEPLYTTSRSSPRVAMIASSKIEYVVSAPRNRPLSPVSAVAKTSALPLNPSQVAKSGFSWTTYEGVNQPMLPTIPSSPASTTVPALSM